MGIFMKSFIIPITLGIGIGIILDLLGLSRWWGLLVFAILVMVFDNNNHKVNEASNGNSQQEDTTKKSPNVDLFEKSYGRKNRHRFKK